MRKLRSRAFTLIELLTVLSILLLLASILFPVFTQAKREAAKAPCASNLRQIGNSFALYAADWDDYYPAAINSWDRQNVELMTEFPKPWDAIPVITEALAPYTRSVALWHCPLDFTWFPTYGASYKINDQKIFAQSLTRFDETKLSVANDMSGHSASPEWMDPCHIRWRQNELFGDGHVEYDFHVTAVNCQ